jgi:hypothetical protein
MCAIMNVYSYSNSHLSSADTIYQVFYEYGVK